MRRSRVGKDYALVFGSHGSSSAHTINSGHEVCSGSHCIPAKMVMMVMLT